jgi:hypothetical protein
LDAEHSVRPSNWPTAVVLNVLNQCRRTCGIPARR